MHSSSSLAVHRIMHSDRLTLVPAAAHHVRAELAGNAEIGELLNAAVSPTWPPGQYDRDAQEFFLQSLEAGGDSAIGWYGWYAIRDSANGDRAALVGCGGYFGPPSELGTVEIGYSICPKSCGRGYATELARKLAQHAMTVDGVARVIAHTHHNNPASITVLTRSGFVQAEITDQPDTLLFEWTPASG